MTPDVFEGECRWERPAQPLTPEEMAEWIRERTRNFSAYPFVALSESAAYAGTALRVLRNRMYDAHCLRRARKRTPKYLDKGGVRR